MCARFDDCDTKRCRYMRTLSERACKHAYLALSERARARMLYFFLPCFRKFSCPGR